MKIEEEQTRLIAQVEAIAHPTRRRLLALLLEKPRYIAELAEALDEPRHRICYHLDVLEHAGIPLASKYEILEKPQSKGKAAKYYKVERDKLRQLLVEISTKIPKILEEKEKISRYPEA